VRWHVCSIAIAYVLSRTGSVLTPEIPVFYPSNTSNANDFAKIDDIVCPKVKDADDGCSVRGKNKKHSTTVATLLISYHLYHCKLPHFLPFPRQHALTPLPMHV